MHPALPEDPSGEGAPEQDVWYALDETDPVEVGEFRQGSPLSRWALARYLVGRAMAESVSRTLLLIAAVLLAAAAGAQWGLHLTSVLVLLLIVALMILLLRWVLVAVLRKLTA